MKVPASSTPSTMEATSSGEAGAAEASATAALTEAENTCSSSSSMSALCSLSFLRREGKMCVTYLHFGCRSSEEITDYPSLVCQDLC